MHDTVRNDLGTATLVADVCLVVLFLVSLLLRFVLLLFVVSLLSPLPSILNFTANASWFFFCCFCCCDDASTSVSATVATTLPCTPPVEEYRPWHVADIFLTEIFNSEVISLNEK